MQNNVEEGPYRERWGPSSLALNEGGSGEDEEHARTLADSELVAEEEDSNGHGDDG